MLKDGLLILYCKKLYNNVTFLLIVILLLLTNGCSFSYLYDKQTRSYANLIYVADIPEKEGMLMTSQLRFNFNNQNINTAKYILKSQININENLQLNSNSGFATQGELWITIKWQLIDKVSNKIYVSSTVYHPAYYNILPSIYASNNNKELPVHLAIKNLANNIGLKIFALLKESKGDFSNFSTPIINNNTAPINNYNENNSSTN